jgi:hypothetical protein
MNYKETHPKASIDETWYLVYIPPQAPAPGQAF